MFGNSVYRTVYNMWRIICKKRHIQRRYNNLVLWKNSKILIASRDIRKHEEILVSYGIDYWLTEIKEDNNKYDKNFKDTIYILNKIIKIIEEFCECEIYQFKKIQDEYKLLFDLINNKRLCKYNKTIHYDDKFYISLKWNTKKDYLGMYYVCKTCNMKDFDFLFKELDKGLIH